VISRSAWTRFAPIVLALACLPAAGETLVSHCEKPAGSDCPRPVWVRPANAKTVQVMRDGGAPWVAIGDVKGSERIAVCIDDSKLKAGRSGACSTRNVPGRKDNWQAKRDVFAAPVAKGKIVVRWQAVTRDTQGQPFDGTAGYLLHRQEDVCLDTSADPRCGSMPWLTDDVGPKLEKVYENIAGRWCFRVQGYTKDRELGAITEVDPRACASPGGTAHLPGHANASATDP
jgi:hypothetical protein